MTANHAEFLVAIQEKRKVRVRFYSRADSGALDRVCAAMEYGRGAEFPDGLNRYWLWNYVGASGSQLLSLLPQEIVQLHVLTEMFDPAEANSVVNDVIHWALEADLLSVGDEVQFRAASGLLQACVS